MERFLKGLEVNIHQLGRSVSPQMRPWTQSVWTAYKRHDEHRNEEKHSNRLNIFDGNRKFIKIYRSVKI